MRTFPALMIGVFGGWAIDDYFTATKPEWMVHTVESALLCATVAFAILLFEHLRYRLLPLVLVAIIAANASEGDWFWVVITGAVLAFDVWQDGWKREEATA